MSQVVFLNGCSSAGKSSIAKSIQSLAPTPWLHIGLDAFIGMLPAQYLEFGTLAHKGYYSFQPGQNHRGSCTKVLTGPLGETFFSQNIPKVIGVLADLGHNMIIDEVIFSKAHFDSYLTNLKNHNVFCVQVKCDYETLIAREKARGDRTLGLANDQFDRLQSYEYAYDLIVDTTHSSSKSCAQTILDQLK
jgi:chloramphenicol 3-O phosphotransferase